MPTKHKRKRGTNDDKTHYDLPPTTSHARSLPVIAPTRDFLTARPRSQGQPPKRRKLHEPQPADDTPKNFARLMAWHTQGKKLAPGLDDGETKQKKRRKQQSTSSPAAKTQAQDPTTTTTSTAVSETQAESPATQALKIRPGETLSEFNFRVDQALPLSGAKSHTSASNGLPADLRVKARLTKHNKRLARMQAEWRATEARLRAKEEEQDEEDEERREEEKLLWDDVKLVGGKKRRKMVEEDDPWKELEKRRGAETRQKNVRDVVLEPPLLKVAGVKNIFSRERHSRPQS